MRDIAFSALYEQDAFAAIETLSKQPDKVASVTACAELVHHLYWEKKDITRVVLMALAGIQSGLTSAIDREADDAPLAAKLRGIAKGLAYDLASFTWSGWDEPGIVLTALHLQIGFEAAKLNLRLARELNKGDLPLSRAHWLLGAHCLAAGERETAYSHFAEARRYAEIAGSHDEVLLCQGYQALVLLMADPHDADRRREFMSILVELAITEPGAEFAGQLKTAWKVFGNESLPGDYGTTPSSA